jgi:predicted acylesterase/phospholipase RssA
MDGLASFINRFNLVKQIPVFAKLSWYDIQRVARHAGIVEYKKGSMVRKEGDPPDNFYCLISGRLQTYTIGQNGRKDNIDFIHRGMHFGIISVFTGENHSQNFEAINDSVVLQIPRNEFLDILKVVPQLGIHFSQMLSKWMRRKVKGYPDVLESMIISVYSPDKNTGNSTYAINLALSLEKETKKKVLYLNLHSRKLNADGKAPSTEMRPKFKKQPERLNDLLENQERISAEIIRNALPADLLHVTFDSGDQSLKKQIAPFVTSLIGEYHYVVADLPNDMDDVVLETLAQSDLVHLITLDHKENLESLRRVIDSLQDNLKGAFRPDRIRVVISSVTEEPAQHPETINKMIDYEVYIRLPFIHDAELKASIDSEEIRFLRCLPESLYSQAVRHVAREIGGVLVGLALGGGAALGVAHIGVLRVLEQEAIPIDVISGSSMGALIAAFWASGFNANDIEKVARQFEKKLAMLRLVDLIPPVSGFIGGRGIRRWLKRYLGDRTFYTTWIPLKIIAYDLVRREELVIASGPLVDAIMQSIAIPGIIEPIRRQDRVIIDGGVLNPLPTNVLCAEGIKKIISVNVLQSPEDVVKGYEQLKAGDDEKAKIRFWTAPVSYCSIHVGRFLQRRFYPNISDIIVLTLQAAEYVIAEQSAQHADVAIHPDLVGIAWYELYKVDALIRRGEEAARLALPKIKALISDENMNGGQS